MVFSTLAGAPKEVSPIVRPSCTVHRAPRTVHRASCAPTRNQSKYHFVSLCATLGLAPHHLPSPFAVYCAPGAPSVHPSYCPHYVQQLTCTCVRARPAPPLLIRARGDQLVRFLVETAQVNTVAHRWTIQSGRPRGSWARARCAIVPARAPTNWPAPAPVPGASIN